MFIEFDSNAPLYNSTSVGYLVAGWAAFWFLGHYVFWALWNCSKGFSCMTLWTGKSGKAVALLHYRRRLCRAQIYCFLAVLGAFHLMYKWQHYPKDLLVGFNVQHQVLFSMAAGHWIVSFWEDLSSGPFINAGLHDAELTTPLHNAYLLHHMMAAGGYVALLALQSCMAVGIFGLLYELPVLMMNHREFIINGTPVPRWWRGEVVIRYWFVLNLLFVVARYTPTGFYIYSLCYWQDDISALGTAEAVVYHCMAIFFTILNYRLHVQYFVAWAKSDRETYARKTTRSAAQSYAADVAERELRDAGSVKINERVHPVCRVHPSVLDRKKGDTLEEDGTCELWVEIESVAYDVTNFMSKHPGGEAVFRKHAGVDATAGFQKAHHSAKARRLMQEYMVGPICRMPNQYRIFEHADVLIAAFWEVVTVVLALGLSVSFVGNSVYASMAPPGSAILNAVVPGLMLGALSGVSLTLLAFCSASFGAFANSKGYRFGLFAMLFYVGITLARQPLPEKMALVCPTGLELAAFAVFLLEDVFEGCSQGIKLSPGSFVAASAVAISWIFRGLWLLLDEAPGHLLAPVLIAPSLSWMVRRIREDRDRSEMVNEALAGLQISGLFCCIALALLRNINHEAAVMMGKCWDLPWDSMAGAIITAFTSLAGIVVLLNSAYVCCSSWAARACAGTILFGVVCAGGLHNSRWLIFVAVFSQLGAIAGRAREKMNQAYDEGKFDQVPAFTIGTQALWDQFRLFTLTALWKLFMIALKAFVNAIVPKEMVFYGCDIPIFEMGSEVDLGVAASFTARPSDDSDEGNADVKTTLNGHEAHTGTNGHTNGKSAVNGESKTTQASDDSDVPQYFICNVGHIDSSHAAGLSDMQRTFNAVRDCWSEFSNGEAKGLMSNVVMLFPYIGGTSFSKEINLSAWKNGEDAYDWYAKSEGHRGVVRDHTGGHLRTFGNLLASLAPVGQIRHQDRCSRCARLCESEEPGKHAPTRCAVCNARTFGYPTI